MPKDTASPTCPNQLTAQIPQRVKVPKGQDDHQVSGILGIFAERLTIEELDKMTHFKFTEEQKGKANFIMNSPMADLNSLLSFQVKDLAVYWSFYSGKIEGNTYSFVQTENLLKDNVTPPKTFEEALMLKNLYNSFISCVYQVREDKPIEINEFNIKGLHSMLTDGLLPIPARGAFRTMPVKITGTDYTPPTDPIEIERTLSEIVSEQYNYEDPISRSIFLHCNIARLQPFLDGNKRTSRLVESVVLMNNNIIPVRSDKQEDFIRYRDCIVHFYETEDYNFYIDFALDTQIARINEIAPAKYQYNGEGHSYGMSR